MNTLSIKFAKNSVQLSFPRFSNDKKYDNFVKNINMKTQYFLRLKKWGNFALKISQIRRRYSLFR